MGQGNTFSVLARSSMANTYLSNRTLRALKTQRTLPHRKWYPNGGHTKSHHSPLTPRRLLNRVPHFLLTFCNFKHTTKMLEIYGYVSRYKYIFLPQINTQIILD